mmetsp:Transcript_34966/g.111306  ORF Transcript_34966/g.111306 Transcript_34966/m.111306 type:complete len:227 (+) Transcript_34966:153-833(+)|eukprot:scaffold15739_cov120-Isochrysis_galbana.AAC.3
MPRPSVSVSGASFLLLLICAQPALAEAANSSSQACSSGLTGDTAFTTCGSFCKEDKRANHCRFCKCRGCPYCPAALEANTDKGKHTPCSTGLTGDFPYRACASFCKIARASTHCAWCKCSDCPFCLAKLTQTVQPVGDDKRIVGGRLARLHPKKHGSLAQPTASAGGDGGAGPVGAQSEGTPPGMLLFCGAVGLWLAVVLHSAWRMVGSHLLFGGSPASTTAASSK